MSPPTSVHRESSVTRQGGAGKSLARPRRKQASDQTRDLFNILPTRPNTLLSPFL